MNKTKIEILGIWYYLGLGFLDKMTKEEGKSLVELGQTEEIFLISKCIFYSRVYACERLGLPVNFTQNDVHDYIDDNGGVYGTFFNEFRIAYIKSMTQDVPVDENADKKKVVKAKK